MRVAIPVKDRGEIFTHKDDDGVFRHFPVEVMLEFAAKYIPICADIVCAKIPLEKRQADHIRNRMGIEQERLDRLSSPYLYFPLLGIFWKDNKTLTIVDGNHRYVKLHEMGQKQVNIFVFKHPFWEQFLLDLPDDPARLTGNSGVIENEKRRQAEAS